jgi:hypothetical protein
VLVVDASEAVVPGATVELTNAHTNTTAFATTEDSKGLRYSDNSSELPGLRWASERRNPSSPRRASSGFMPLFMTLRIGVVAN